ncbi:MAG: DUF6629 family protein [Patescibacteria group bacterium]
MCFSPEVSFISSGVLGLTGAASIVVAPKNTKILGLVPFAFAAQQLLEGVQWLALRTGSENLIAGYGYLFFALLLWPIAVPLAVYLVDPASRRRVRWFIIGGLMITAYFLFSLLQSGVGADIFGGSIRYTFFNALNYPGAEYVYLIVTAGALLVSSIKVFRYFAGGVVVSAIAANFFFNVVFVSVWCFFASLLSLLIFAYLLVERRKKGTA